MRERVLLILFAGLVLMGLASPVSAGHPPLDTQEPELLSLAIDPPVAVSGAPITATLRARDRGSGLKRWTVTLRSPSGSRQLEIMGSVPAVPALALGVYG